MNQFLKDLPLILFFIFLIAWPIVMYCLFHPKEVARERALNQADREEKDRKQIFRSTTNDPEEVYKYFVSHSNLPGFDKTYRNVPLEDWLAPVLQKLPENARSAYFSHMEHGPYLDKYLVDLAKFSMDLGSLVNDIWHKRPSVLTDESRAILEEQEPFLFYDELDIVIEGYTNGLPSKEINIENCFGEALNFFDDDLVTGKTKSIDGLILTCVRFGIAYSEHQNSIILRKQAEQEAREKAEREARAKREAELAEQARREAEERKQTAAQRQPVPQPTSGKLDSSVANFFSASKPVAAYTPNQQQAPASDLSSITFTDSSGPVAAYQAKSTDAQSTSVLTAEMTKEELKVVCKAWLQAQNYTDIHVYACDRTGKSYGDIAAKDKNGARCYFNCVASAEPVEDSALSELFIVELAMKPDHIGLMTNSTFTEAAIQQANKKHYYLYDGNCLKQGKKPLNYAAVHDDEQKKSVNRVASTATGNMSGFTDQQLAQLDAAFLRSRGFKNIKVQFTPPNPRGPGDNLIFANDEFGKTWAFECIAGKEPLGFIPIMGAVAARCNYNTDRCGVITSSKFDEKSIYDATQRGVKLFYLKLDAMDSDNVYTL